MSSGLPWRPIEGVHVHRSGTVTYPPIISLTMSIETAYFIGSLLRREEERTHDLAFSSGKVLMDKAEALHMEKLSSV